MVTIAADLSKEEAPAQIVKEAVDKLGGELLASTYRVSQKNALSESSSCKQQPRGDQVQDVLNMISLRLLLAG